MLETPSLKRETLYGMPAADQILFNRDYVLGYSYYFRQAKWALEIIDPGDFERKDPFRSDFRIPEIFRADREDYSGFGYDRGHLAASANHRENELYNSETFLLSNMSPQDPDFNRGIWRKLEEAVRMLSSEKRILETFVISGPIFNFDMPVKEIGDDTANEVTLPVPHAYFKSILAENNRGVFWMWSFILPNKGSKNSLASFRVPTTRVERFAGIRLWERLRGRKVATEKQKIRKMWKL